MIEKIIQTKNYRVSIIKLVFNRFKKIASNIILNDNSTSQTIVLYLIESGVRDFKDSSQDHHAHFVH